MKYTIGAAPHIHDNVSIKSIMWNVIFALLPAFAFSVYYFGVFALFTVLYAVGSAVITEAIIQKFRGVEITVIDGSAVVSGLLLGFNLPVGVPWWIPVIGGIFAMGIGKHVFGGLGFNLLNPALLGRAFLMASWPSIMTSWSPTSLGSISGISSSSLAMASGKINALISSATPLGVAKMLRDDAFVSSLGVNFQQGKEVAGMLMNRLSSFEVIQNLFWGNVGGVIGETSVLALLLGAGWLAHKHFIEWRIPTFYIGTVFILTYIFGGVDGFFSASILLPVFHIFSGGLILGAFFMATDMVTSPITKRGRVFFGVGLGLLTVLFRLKGGYPEGVSYAILLMNLTVPLIDKYTIPKFFGVTSKGIRK